MTSIDLGPVFTQIPKGMVSTVNPSSEPVTVNAYEDILLECGNANTVIYAPESIYSSRKALKLSSTNTSTTIAYSRGTINPKYKPEWTKQSATLDKTNKKLTIVLKGAVNTTNYTSNVTTTLAASDITVYIDGEEATGITKSLTAANPTTGASVTHTLTLSNFEETIKQSGKSFMEWSGNVAIKIAGRGKATGTYTANVLKDSYGNQSMMETDETDGTWINVTVNDGTITQNTAGKMFTDFIKPKIEKTSSTKDTTNKKETIVFTVMDKYIDKSDLLTASDITVYVDGVAASSVTKTLTNTAITATVNGSTQTVGHKYTLVLSNFEQSTKQTGKNYLEWSGTVSIKIAAGAVKDKSSNTNDATTLTGDLVDFIKPRIEKTSSTKDATNKKETIVFTVMDKYIDTSDLLTASDITVYVDGEAASSVTKTLTNTAIKATVNGTSKTVGHTYTLVLTGFEQSTKQTGKNYLEWSGTVSIKIAAGAVKDTSSNTNDATTLTGDLVDFIKPRIEKTSSTKGTNTETIVFTVMDKYIDTSDLLTASDITVYVDGVAASSVTKTLINTAVKATVNGTSKTVGHTYTLVLSNFQQSSRQSGKSYLEWSGNVSIKIAAGAVKDTSSNKNEATTLTGDFADFIKPEFTYEYSNTVINYNKSSKKVTVVFDITDKFFNSTTMTKDSITVKINASTAANSALTKTLTKLSNITGTVNGVANTKIGEKYKLEVTGFDQGDGLNYSGPMSLVFASGIITDKSSNKNNQKTITIGIDDPSTGDGHDSSVVVDLVDPIWSTQNVNIDKTNDKVTVDLVATDKYYASNSLDTSDITVYVDGTAITGTTNVTKSLSAATTVTNGVKYTLTLSNWKAATRATGTYRDYSGTTKIVIAGETITDQSGNTSNQQEFTLGLADFLEPEIEKVSSTKNAIVKTETIVFNVLDKYIDSSDLLTSSDITVYVDGEAASSVTKRLTSTAITATVNGSTQTVGHKYTLVLSNFEQSTKQTGKNYLEWSGTVSIKIAAGAVKDTSSNTNAQATLTGDLVDFIKPRIEKTSSTKDATNKKETIVFTVMDKYIDTSDLLTASDITVYVDGEAASSVTKTLTNTAITATVNGTSKTVGHTYTLVLSRFEQSTKQTGKNYLEWSGTVSIKIAAGAVKDTSSNTNDATTLTGDLVDFIKPRIEKTSSTKDATNKKETIVFTVMDKYIDTSDLLTASDITVYVDGETASNITKTLTNSAITATVNGATQTVGHTYTLVLSNFEKTINSNGYRDWSGTVSISVAAGAVKDTSSNTNDATTLTGDYVDFINPTIKYTHQSTNIDKTNKKYVMEFTVTDKYYTSGQLTIDDLTINMQNGQKDANGNLIVYNLKNEPVTITLNATAITVASMKMTNTSNAVVTATNQTIGHTYTLTISNLEQLEVEEGFTTADYSGIVTVAIAGSKITDRTGNTNTATTITSGISLEGTTTSGSSTEVDVVDPILERVSSSANAVDQTATITFKGTDTYYASNAITAANIKVLVNGGTTEPTGITKSLSAVTKLEESRTVSGTTSTVQYGVQYTLTISGFSTTANQVKIQIPTGMVTDASGNTNKETELIVYNVLKSAASETVKTSGFLRNTSIARQDIENITFVSSLDNSTGTDVKQAWDVSAQGDGSIMAWTKESAAPYTVYIGSDYEIFANQNSGYLFSFIGYGESCTATEAVTNLNLLNTSSVTDMMYMFSCFGYTAMTSLDLGTFDTSNVTRMVMMFCSVGYMKMTSFNLGTAFDTSNVTDMQHMFDSCGENAMQTLILGDKFDTSNVTDMNYMFEQCGKIALKELNLGTKFNTSKVTNMRYMFYACGKDQMTNFNLGSLFDTSNVTDMSGMFAYCGQTAMTSLDLGELFDTSKVTNMRKMFYGMRFYLNDKPRFRSKV